MRLQEIEKNADFPASPPIEYLTSYVIDLTVG